VAITRTTLADDDGSGTTGTIWNNARLQLVYDAIENNWEATAYTPTWGNTGTANTTTGSTITGFYSKIGKKVSFGIQLTWGSGTVAGSGSWTFTLPLTAIASGVYGGAHATISDASTGNLYLGNVLSASTTTIVLYNNASPLAPVSGTVPFTWATGDQVYISGRYWTP
jgi:hypothetical protein